METNKYNIGDIVWVLFAVKAIKGKVVGVLEGNRYLIRSTDFFGGLYLTDFSMKYGLANFVDTKLYEENEIFISKEELLKSL